MSHEISINEKTGKQEMFTAKEPAWHGLGTVLDGPATAAQAIEAAGLDWEVEKRQLMYNFGGKREKTPGIYATVRMDTGQYLGTVGENYTVVQNKDVFAFFDPLVDEDEAVYHTAGALGRGERIWVLAKLPAHIQVGKDDLIEQYVLLHNTHGGTGAVVAAMTPVRVVCNNTLTAALHGTRNKVSIRHTQNAKDRLEQAHMILGISNRYKDELEPIFNEMARKQVKDKDLDFLLDSMYPKDPETELSGMGKKTRELIKEAFEVGTGQELETTNGTLFGFYNAVTFYVDHLRKTTSPESRATGTWFDGKNGYRQRAFDVALDMIS